MLRKLEADVLKVQSIHHESVINPSKTTGTAISRNFMPNSHRAYQLVSWPISISRVPPHGVLATMIAGLLALWDLTPGTGILTWRC